MSQESGDARNEPRRQPRDDRSGEPHRTNDDPEGDDPTRWFATTAVRAGLTLIGVVLLLFAVGQAVGLPLLDLTTEALSSQTGRWLVVAFFALSLIGVAQRITATG